MARFGRGAVRAVRRRKGKVGVEGGRWRGGERGRGGEAGATLALLVLWRRCGEHRRRVVAFIGQGRGVGYGGNDGHDDAPAVCREGGGPSTGRRSSEWGRARPRRRGRKATTGACGWTGASGEGGPGRNVAWVRRRGRGDKEEGVALGWRRCRGASGVGGVCARHGLAG